MIVGLIVAFGIPALIQSVEKTQFQSALKKDISVISQAAMNISNDYGGTMGPVWGIDANAPMLAFAAKMNTVKTCKWAVSGCGDDYPNALTFHKDIVLTSDFVTEPKIVLNDGTIISFFSFNSNCTSTRGTWTNACGNIMVDVNGNNGPNTVGIDIYELEVTDGAVYPGGMPAGTYYNQCFPTDATNRSGWGCAYNVMVGKDYNYY